MDIVSFFTKWLKKSKPDPMSPFQSPKKMTKDPTSKDPIPTHPGLERSQFHELHHVFREFDANGDGKISSTDLGSIMARLGHPTSDDELRSMIREADLDGDGLIDFNEFVDMHVSGTDRTTVLEDLRQAFLVYDVDRNGLISPEELGNILKSIGHNSSIDECKKMISMVDHNGDGYVDFQEFKMMMMKSLPSKLQREIEG
ncbi:probable calcium-binding protein CML25 [Magnolia sinica]|uniref:probable calcium-binding protein CML25 n=1 Tax=Magnolia sinica TaxID=86752 RepID=UPI00265B2D1A|nr:probable calcium-binding protein CML25 [Magnolia sinica]